MKADGRRIAQLACAAALSFALACGCGTAFAHAGGAGGAGASGAGGTAGGAAGVGGFGGHGGVGGHGFGHVGTPRGFVHVANSMEASNQVAHIGCCGAGAGVVSPIWDPYFWLEHGYAVPQADSQAATATLPAPVAYASPQNASWYYCPDSGVYYPYVRQCASGWQQVSPTPSS